MKSSSHYVYMLVDPRDDTVFYVGKGQGTRAWHHERNVRTGTERNAAKALRIGEILEASLTVGVEIVASFDNAADALDLERDLIRSLKDGLTNIANGSQCRLRAGLAFARHSLSRVVPREVYARDASPTDLLLYDYLVSSMRVQVNILEFQIAHAR